MTALDSDLSRLQGARLERWCQTPATHVPGSDAAGALIARLGLATLYPVSPEIPNLYHAYVGDPTRPTDSNWDSPSGEVYTWRWELGHVEAAFYSLLVRKRPTWVSWPLLPAVLKLCGELRTPDELYDAGVLSADAHRVATALDEAGGTLATGDLRRQAGFPTGRDQRAAYLKAVEELDIRLLLAKVFDPAPEGSKEAAMSHALVSARYPRFVAEAEAMAEAEALDRVLRAYLPFAAYAVPAPLAKALRLTSVTLEDGLEKLMVSGEAVRVALDGHKGPCYAWVGGPS